jgi:hypothetical protein
MQGKLHSIITHEGLEGEYRYILFLEPRGWIGVSGNPNPAALTPEGDSVPNVQEAESANYNTALPTLQYPQTHTHTHTNRCHSFTIIPLTPPFIFRPPISISANPSVVHRGGTVCTIQNLQRTLQLLFLLHLTPINLVRT